jgi:hypothetical protein
MSWKTDLNTIVTPKITIDIFLLALCDKIQSKLPNKEFSILCKGEFNNEGFYVSSEYIIPKQQVTETKIKYSDLTALIQDGYNCVIHSHHTMGGEFSTDDRDSINSIFDCSVMYTVDGFQKGNIKLRKGDGLYLIPTKEVYPIMDYEFNIKGFKNIKVIKQKKWTSKKGTKTKTYKNYSCDKKCNSCNLYGTMWCINYIYDMEGEVDERNSEVINSLDGWEGWDNI